MKKNLRYVLLAFVAMFGFGNAMAEDVIWQEDWSSWADYIKVDPNGINSGYTFTGTTFKDDGSYKGGTAVYNENLAGGEAPELLIAKSGGSFQAIINLGEKSGDMMLSFKCNKNITVEVTGGTLGEKTNTGNDYVYPITNASGTLTITFINSLSSNCRFDNAKLSQGEGKKPAGLSWGTSARTVTLGADDNVFPQLTNNNNLPIDYSSSEPTVATIDAEGVITLVAEGKTVITAEFKGNDEYEAAKVEYTLTVKEAQPQTEAITVANALEIIADLEDGKTTSETYQVKGIIVGTPDFQRKKDGSLYGNCNFDIADTQGGNEKLTVFRAKSFGNVNFTEEEVSAPILKEGYEVVLQGKLQKFVKDGVMTPELTSCYLISVKSDPTGINETKVSAENRGVIYNMAGQVVTKSYKGLVILNGKKYVQK